MSALQARCEALEQELEQTRHELGRLRTAEWERAVLEEHTQELEGEIMALRARLDPEVVRLDTMAPHPGAFAAAMVILVSGLAFHVMQVSHHRQLAGYHLQAMADRTQLFEAQVELERLRGHGTSLEDGKQLAPRQAQGGTVHRTGRVVHVSGDALAVSGEQCELEVVTAPPETRFTCRAELRCGGVVVYGGPQRGYLRCDFAQGSPSAGRDYRDTDDDGDPRFTLDLAHDRVVAADDVQARPWLIEVELDRL